jgi:hypothetical protein
MNGGLFTAQAHPENWPPQIGDIWKADGHEYAALWANWADDHVMIHGIDRARIYEAGEFRAAYPDAQLIRRRVTTG